MKRKQSSKLKSFELKKRDKEQINLIPLAIIACEGVCTEPNYILSIVRKLISEEKIAAGSVVIPSHQHTDPEGVLNDLLNYKVDYKLFNEKWIVIDRDEVRTISSNSSGHPLQNFQNAIKNAAEKGVDVAWSNPCFELYIIEHFDYRTTGGDRKDIQQKALEYLVKKEKCPLVQKLKI